MPLFASQHFLTHAINKDEHVAARFNNKLMVGYSCFNTVQIFTITMIPKCEEFSRRMVAGEVGGDNFGILMVLGLYSIYRFLGSLGGDYLSFLYSKLWRT